MLTDNKPTGPPCGLVTNSVTIWKQSGMLSILSMISVFMGHYKLLDIIQYFEGLLSYERLKEREEEERKRERERESLEYVQTQ